jgi:hypothetical protein
LKFLWAIFATAQNYRDNTQSVLPGYRERIVQVRLHDHEGGLNLAMPDTAVAAIVKKGEDAGKLLVDDFNFQHHQWVRFRVLMMQVETRLAEMAKTLEKTTYWDLLESKLADEAYPYACGVESLNRIKQRLDAICTRNRHLKPAMPSKTGLMGKFWYNGLSLYALKPVA